MGSVIVRRAIPSDCAGLSFDMRPIDRLEMSAMSGEPDEAPRRAQQLWDLCIRSPKGGRVAFYNGQIACMWGVVCPTVLGSTGHPWMLGTEVLADPAFGRTFLRRCRGGFLDSIPDRVTSMWNLVHVENTVAIRWLRFMGFRFDAAPIEHNGHEWLKFTMEAS